MIKIVFAVLLILIFGGCIQNIPTAPYFETVDEVFEWVTENIEYTQDKEDSWQSPEQTYELLSGHCSDMGLLEMYFLDEMGIESEMYWVTFLFFASDSVHALILVETETIPRNSTSLGNVNPTNYEIIRTTSYEQSLALAVLNRSLQ